MIETIKIESMEIRTGMSKTGRAYSMPVIETEDGRKMSMYIDREYDVKKGNLEKIQAWKVGDTKEVITEQNGDFLNFSLPSKTDIIEQDMFNLEGRVSKIEELLKNAKKKTE